jgi:hypothetical protein
MKRTQCMNSDGTPKAGYRGRADAVQVAKHVTYARRNEGPAKAYLCSICRLWHVGHDNLADPAA